jgi:hypothetical protein
MAVPRRASEDIGSVRVSAESASGLHDERIDPATKAVHWSVALPRTSIFHLRRRSLARGIVLALGALCAALLLAGLPHVEALHGSPWEIVAVLGAACAMVETARCLKRRWSLYHAGVLIFLCSDLMILVLALFLWLYL